MSTQEKIYLKIEKVESYLRKIKNLGKIDLSVLNKDEQKRVALERFFYLACDGVISVLEMLINYRDYQRASVYTENIEILYENKEICEAQMQLLFKIIGFRNVLSHDYEKLNLEILADVANNGISEIKVWLDSLKTKI